MGKKDDTEKKIIAVLKHQDDELKNIKISKQSNLKKNIESSEKLLKELGYDVNDVTRTRDEEKIKVIHMNSWEEIVKNSEGFIDNENKIEDLFSKEELENNYNAIKELNAEYNSLFRLDKYDIAIAVVSGIISSLIDILLVGIPEKTPIGIKEKSLGNFVREYFDKRFPEEEMEKLANSKISKVPFDAQDNRNTIINVEGLSAYYHRLLQLGHDPILGFVFGVTDILNGTMTTIDKKGAFHIQSIPNYVDRTEKDIFSALLKQIIHFKSDITTSMGLPVPLMSLFDFLQFGKIGADDQTIAEIVQGMYFEGYDFIHFCSSSIPVMISEIITRIGYSIKRIKEGHSIKESIPVSLDRQKNPKLATMLFITQSTASAINMGKISFTHNPLDINYAQWLLFFKYAFKQLRWELIDKIEERDKYIYGKNNKELMNVYNEIDSKFNDLLKNHIIIMG